ncbi:MAG: MoxR family ATPase [Clostridiales bacterium]
MNAIIIKELCENIRENISKVIIGKDDVIDFVITTFLAGGNVLLDDIPGVGKTVMSKSLAKSVNCIFKRIQFTPDLLPTDLTGVNYFNQKDCEFIFKEGPIFSNIVLADEINRATPRTQSSLLECMEEDQVTVDGETRILDKPFFVIATQNPIENHGTFPLPEAQLDRFLMKIKIGYPSYSEGRNILDSMEKGHNFDKIIAVCDREDIVKAQKYIYNIKVSSAVKDYINDIVELTRKNSKIALGVSPRGSLYLMKASQAFAALNGREYVLPDDVKKLVLPVFSHRIILKETMSLETVKSAEIVLSTILSQIQVPIENI